MTSATQLIYEHVMRRIGDEQPVNEADRCAIANYVLELRHQRDGYQANWAHEKRRADALSKAVESGEDDICPDCGRENCHPRRVDVDRWMCDSDDGRADARYDNARDEGVS